MEGLARVRAVVYGVFVALQPLFVFYGWSSEGETQLWINVVDGVLAAFVGTLAIVNVPRDGGDVGGWE